MNQSPELWVARDHELEAAVAGTTLALMEHRWSVVSGGVTIADYARAVGRNRSTIGKYVKAWELWQERRGSTSDLSPDSVLELASMTLERQQAHEIVAEAKGVSIGHVRKQLPHVAKEVQHVIADHVEAGKSREEALDYATRLVAGREAERNRVARRQEEQQAKPGFFAWNRIGMELGKAEKAMRGAVQLMRESGIEDAETLALLRGECGSVAAQIRLFELACAERAGARVDWDAAAAELLD